jgi:glucose-6-phosphate-specific signal transduction histidine kinase
MSFEPDDDPVKRSSSERYSRVASPLDWAIVLGASSSIFFGFFLDIAVNPPSYFQLFDNMVLLAALYAVTAATAMFIMPVIFHSAHYHRFDVEKFLLVTKGYVLIGIVCVTLAIYLGLRLASDSKLPIQISYGLASLPFILIFLRFLRYSQEISFKGTKLNQPALIQTILFGH